MTWCALACDQDLSLPYSLKMVDLLASTLIACNYDPYVSVEETHFNYVPISTRLLLNILMSAARSDVEILIHDDTWTKGEKGVSKERIEYNTSQRHNELHKREKIAFTAIAHARMLGQRTGTGAAEAIGASSSLHKDTHGRQVRVMLVGNPCQNQLVLEAVGNLQTRSPKSSAPPDGYRIALCRPHVTTNNVFVC